MEQKLDYIIVGGGLAGTCLAVRFLQQKKTFAWIDAPGKSRASVVAAGLFNAITNKVMNKSWRADEFFDSLHTFYPAAEKLTGRHFFHPLPIYRPFLSVHEQNLWMAKSGEPRMERFVKQIVTDSQFGDQVQDPFGGIVINQSGYLDVNLFVAAVAELVKARGLFFEEPFEYDRLQLGDAVHYKNLKANFVIFCEGTAIQLNPYFQWVPVKSLKGETLEIKIDRSLTQLFNRGVYLVPQGNGNYKVGATYQHHAEPGISEEGKQELTEKLVGLLKLPFEIALQDWGFRPTIIDRKPVLGPHPEHARLICFNALGTKGVSLAPHFSGVLANWLQGGGQLEKDVNISRFYALYSKF